MLHREEIELSDPTKNQPVICISCLTGQPGCWSFHYLQE